jgi:hypothetical protein
VEGGQNAVYQTGNCRFAHITEAERGQRDAELSARDVAVQVNERALNGLRPAVPLRRQLIDAAPPYCYQGKLGRDEKRIRQQQKRHQQDLEGDLAEAEVLGGHRNGWVR